MQKYKIVIGDTFGGYGTYKDNLSLNEAIEMEEGLDLDYFTLSFILRTEQNNNTDQLDVSKEKELPGWLETLYNVNPGLAERAEKYIDTVWNKAIDAAANNIKVIKNENTSQILSNLIDKQSILNINQVE